MNLFFSDNVPVSQDFYSIIKRNLSQCFQDSIKQGNIDLATNLIEGGISLNEPLPNGEMPLRFAVRLDKQELVSVLLKLGADPEIKDSQQLSAIDEAILMENESMLAIILGYKIGKDVKEVQEQIKCKGSASHVNQLKNKIEKISTVDVQKLTPINKAAYEGKLGQFTELYLETINELDANGLAPIHYAILGNQSAAIEKLIELGTKINIVTSEGDSLLHFAAITGSSQILNRVMNLGIDLNHKNSAGATALHYASARDNLAVVESLVKAGARPQVLDNQGISPLAMIGMSAFERDPLSLPKEQIVLFVTASLFLLSELACRQLVSESPLFSVDELRLLFPLALFKVVTHVSHAVSETFILLRNWQDLKNSEEKRVNKFMPMMFLLGLEVIWPVPLQFAKTRSIVFTAFEELKNSWKYVGYRNWAVTRNVVVYSFTAVTSMFQLYSTWDIIRERLRSGLFHEIFIASNPST